MTLVCRDLDLDVKRYPPRAVLNWGQQRQERAAGPRGGAKDARNGLEETYAEAYAEYQRRLRQANALDFDDLLMMTVHLFRAFPDGARELAASVPARAGRRVPGHQPRAVRPDPRALRRVPGGDASSRPPTDEVEPAELMVVGDADQSIYAFRGANIRNIMDFEQDFPDARTVMLEQNYRSTQTILTAANAVISRNERPQAEEPVDRRGCRRRDRRLRRRRRARRGQVRRRGDRQAHRCRAVPGPATSRSSTAPTPSPVSSRRCSSASGCPTASWVASGSTSGARCATRWPTCGCWPTRPTRSRCAGS